MIERRGLMLVLSSPSGAGKTSLSRRLLDVEPDIALSVSATTRPRRPGEVEGKHYYFLAPQDFSTNINKGYFLEYAKVFGYYYGTPAEPVHDRLKQGRDVLFDIDWQGTQQLKDAARDDLVSVFILPPSKQALRERLHKRAQDDAEVIEKRIAAATEEMSHYVEADFMVVNDDFDTALHQMMSIVSAQHCRLPVSGQEDLVSDLLG